MNVLVRVVGIQDRYPAETSMMMVETLLFDSTARLYSRFALILMLFQSFDNLGEEATPQQLDASSHSLQNQYN